MIAPIGVGLIVPNSAPACEVAASTASTASAVAVGLLREGRRRLQGDPLELSAARVSST